MARSIDIAEALGRIDALAKGWERDAKTYTAAGNETAAAAARQCAGALRQAAQTIDAAVV